MISELFTVAVLVGIAHSGIRLATPYLFASLGEMFGQRSGVLNLGVDGIMLMGAFSAFYVVYNTGNLWLGVGVALLVGMLMGLLMAVVSVTMQAEQGISGIGLYLFGLGLSSLLFKTMIGSVESVSGFRRSADSVPERHSNHRRDLLRPQHPGLSGLSDGADQLVSCSTRPPSA